MVFGLKNTFLVAVMGIVSLATGFPGLSNHDNIVGFESAQLRAPASLPILRRQNEAAQLFNATEFGLSAGCVQAMDTPVSCSQDLLTLVYGGAESATDDDLASLCTSACTDSLIQLGQKISEGCTADDVLASPESNSTEHLPGTDSQASVFGRDNVVFSPSAAFEYALLNYQLICSKDR